eukprot:GHVP01062747.1.p1 GENE.GHVP01062747.1~~GHVP01062747.1.p1  ORF type:complete len:436 (+),score=20.57 GHVP01062747.1:34-1341(+)
MSTFEPQPLRSMASGFEPLSRSPNTGVVPPFPINGSFRPHYTKNRSPLPNGRSQAYLAEAQRNIAHLSSLLSTNNQSLSSRIPPFPNGRLRINGVPLIPLHAADWGEEQQHSSFTLPAHHIRQLSGSKTLKYAPVRHPSPNHLIYHSSKEPMIYQGHQVGLRHFRSNEQMYPAMFNDTYRYQKKDLVVEQNPVLDKNADSKGRCVLCQCISYRLEESARNVPMEIHELATNELAVDPHMGIVGKYHGVCHEKGGSCLPIRFRSSVESEGSQKSDEKLSPGTSQDNGVRDNSSIISQCSTDVPGSSLTLSSSEKAKRFAELSAANFSQNGRRNSEPCASSRLDGMDFEAMMGDGEDTLGQGSPTGLVPSRIKLPLGRESKTDSPHQAKGDSSPAFSVSTYHHMEATTCWPFDYVLFPPMICTESSLTTALHPSPSV